jgi:hypothetical protein
MWAGRPAAIAIAGRRVNRAFEHTADEGDIRCVKSEGYVRSECFLVLIAEEVLLRLRAIRG